MSSGQAQQTVLFGGTTIVQFDAVVLYINGIQYTYLCVAADVASGVSPATVQRIAAGFNSNQQPLPQLFSPFYTAAANGLLLTVMCNSFSNSSPAFSVAYFGTGNATMTASGPTFVGGSGGASVSIQSQGGPIGSGQAAAVSTGGFIAQTSYYASKNGIG